MTGKQPTRELKAFGTEVARLRINADLRRSQLAALVAVTTSYIGQVETGATRCRLDFATRLDQAMGCGNAAADAWEDLIKTSPYPRYFTNFTKVESTATLIRAYESVLVYGLLQTPAYARALLVTDDSFEGRMKRQAVISRAHGPLLVVLLDESVLYREVGSAEVMREQLEHLATVVSDRVILQIVPTKKYYDGAHSSFTIAVQPEGGEVAYLSHLTGGVTTNEPSDTLHADKAFAVLQARALSVDASVELIRRISEERYGRSDLAEGTQEQRER